VDPPTTRARIRRRRAPASAAARISHNAGWPLELLFVEIAMFYFQAGWAKLSDAGLRWDDGYTLQFYLLAKGGPAAEWLATHLWLCSAASVAVHVFELGFPVAVFARRLRPFALAAGLAFHAGTTVFLGVVFWPLWALYALFVPWSAFAVTVSSRLRSPRTAARRDP
jgi:hypothetical protein